MRVDVGGSAATPSSVTSFADPSSKPSDVAPSTVVVVPPSSLVLVELQ